MTRPLNPTLTKTWKIHLPATLAGRVEFMLFDSIHKKPRYGERGKLITELLEKWVAEQDALAKAMNPNPIVEHGLVLGNRMCIDPNS